MAGFRDGMEVMIIIHIVMVKRNMCKYVHVAKTVRGICVVNLSTWVMS